MKRRTLVLAVLVAVLISSSATWVASRQIRSPAEAAARTAAPPPSRILVPVVEQVLATEVVTRGSAHYRSPRTLSVAPSGLKSGPQVVTSLPTAGSFVDNGDVLMTISGRPVIVLKGAQPSYRDLGPGMAGTDVRQLERALRRLGLGPGPVDGVYDFATGEAVAALYRSHGHEPMVAGESELRAARPLEARLLASSRALPGVQLPADEVIFVPAPPLRVTQLPVSVGAMPERELVTVTDAEVVIDGLLPVEHAKMAKRGAPVLIDEPSLGIKAKGRISAVAARAGTNGADAFHVSFEVAVDDPPPTLVGASVRLTLPVRTTRDEQLTVPVTAVSLGPDGGSRVERVVDGNVDLVPVETGFSADGYVSVTPQGGALAAGDMVVVGFQDGRQGRA